jgi:hypothetical protein
MATVRKEILLRCAVEDAWSALRDWRAVHTPLVPGFLIDASAEGEDRIVTFFDGVEVMGRFISCDDAERRVAWAVGPENVIGFTHYSASAVVDAVDGRTTRLVWTADLLPHELSSSVAELMDMSLSVVKKTLERRADQLHATVRCDNAQIDTEQGARTKWWNRRHFSIDLQL